MCIVMYVMPEGVSEPVLIQNIKIMIEFWTFQ